MPKDDEYRYLIQGAQRLSDWVITFSVLTNEPDSAEARRALEMLRSMEVARAFRAAFPRGGGRTRRE
jgi:hypothetical protein